MAEGISLLLTHSQPRWFTQTPPSTTPDYAIDGRLLAPVRFPNDLIWDGAARSLHSFNAAETKACSVELPRRNLGHGLDIRLMASLTPQLAKLSSLQARVLALMLDTSPQAVHMHMRPQSQPGWMEPVKTRGRRVNGRLSPLG